MQLQPRSVSYVSFLLYCFQKEEKKRKKKKAKVPKIAENNVHTINHHEFYLQSSSPVHRVPPATLLVKITGKNQVIEITSLRCIFPHKVHLP